MNKNSTDPFHRLYQLENQIQNAQRKLTEAQLELADKISQKRSFLENNSHWYISRDQTPPNLAQKLL